MALEKTILVIQDCDCLPQLNMVKTIVSQQWRFQIDIWYILWRAWPILQAATWCTSSLNILTLGVIHHQVYIIEKEGNSSLVYARFLPWETLIALHSLRPT